LLFFVSGIAFLTTMVNAATAPWLVGKLGITAQPAARQTLIRMFHSQLVGWSQDKEHPPEVTKKLQEMLLVAKHHIDHQAVSTDGPVSKRAIKSLKGMGSHAGRSSNGSDMSTNSSPQSSKSGYRERHKTLDHLDNDNVEDNAKIITELVGLAEEYSKLSPEDLDLFGEALPENMLGKDHILGKIDPDGKYILPQNMLGKVDEMINLVSEQYVDAGMAKVVNQCFLTLVHNNYWKLIEDRKLRPGSPEADILLTSVRVSLSPYRADLVDFEYIEERVISTEELEAEDAIGAEFGALSDSSTARAPKNGRLANLVSSAHFNIFIAISILANTVVICCEELGLGGEAKAASVSYLILDAIFTTIFIVEFALKFAWLKFGYFKDAWNKFDFCLVLVGVFGVVMNTISEFASEGSDISAGRVLRLARVLRTTRFLRVFRLFHAKMSADKFISFDLARLMKKISVMHCFVLAHLWAQADLVVYFGGNGRLDEEDESEIARCILQSQVATYKALLAAADAQRHMKRGLHDELKSLYMRRDITEALGRFVEKAHEDGAISATEAHAILHPLHEQVSTCMSKLNDRASGVFHMSRKELKSRYGGPFGDEYCSPSQPAAWAMARGHPASISEHPHVPAMRDPIEDLAIDKSLSVLSVDT